MEINLGNSFGGGIGVRPETAGEGVDNARRTTGDAAQVARSRPNLTVGEGRADISSAEPVADVPDSTLRRDDDLGKLVGAAFNMPPPPMPDFGG